MTDSIRNLLDLRAYHCGELLIANRNNVRFVIDLHTSAVKAIDKSIEAARVSRMAHGVLVDGLLARLHNAQIVLERAREDREAKARSFRESIDRRNQRIEARDRERAGMRERMGRMDEEIAELKATLKTTRKGRDTFMYLLYAERAAAQALNERLAEYEARDATRAAQAEPEAEPSEERQAPEGAFLAAVRTECTRARAKHPGTEALCNALAEETGEVAQALADEPYDHVYVECVQVASTAMRIALEGDRAVDGIRRRRGLDALPGAVHTVEVDMRNAPTLQGHEHGA